jgi:type II secretory pathway component GspD/PulD (secretin)
LVLVAAGVIIWWVGFHSVQAPLPAAEQKVEAKEASASDSAKQKEKASARGRRGGASDANQLKSEAQPAGGEPNKPAQAQPSESKPGAAEPNKPGQPANAPAAKPDEAKPGEGRPPEAKPGEAKPPEAKPGQPKVKEDPNDPLEAVNLKDVEMKNIIEKIAQWTGKTVIPSDQAMTQKLTIYAPEKMPRSKALLKIYSALRMKGYLPEVVDDTIFLKPLAEAKLGTYPIVGPDQPLAQFENAGQVVQKFFKLAHYSPAQMSQIVQPLVGEYGHVSADEAGGRLLVIDTVGNLRRVEQIIAQFDLPDAGRAVSEVFEIQHGDPVEIVQFLRMLLGESPDGRRGGPMRGRSPAMSRPGGPSGGPPSGGPGGASKTATSVVIGASDIPLVLFPVPKAKQVIARGSAEDIRLISEWIKKLDVAESVKSESETVAIVNGDAREIAQRIEQSLQQMSGTDARPNVVVTALEQSRQIMIFGRADMREMVRGMIAEADMPPGSQFEHENFKLEHADPDQVKANIEGLYESQSGSMMSYSYRSYRSRNIQPSETVKVISYPSMKQVTVIASRENLEKIRKQIKEWDVALDINQVKPRIIELKNSDPVKMAELLTKLFSEASDDSSRNFMRMIFFGDDAEQKKKIVGPLYGQLTFENVPETKKIIVISKIPEAYAIIEQLVLDLDRQEMAEIPKVVQLKYADPEDLSERLNAMFNEPGTIAPIRRTPSGLGNYSMEQGASSGGQSGGNQSGGGGGGNNSGNNPNEYTPWWSRGGSPRGAMGQQPLSNVIGHVRFIPDPRSKSILVLSPPEFHNDIKQMIATLDVPGMQVMIRATVVEVNHSALTSLGLQIATNPAAFGNLEENAVTALSSLTSLSTGGSAAPANTPLGATGTGTIAGTTASVYALIDFLVKHVNAKILNEQTLWTEDNEEASFFKGSKVAFRTSTSIVSSTISQSSFTFEKVGMTLAVRPSITPEKNVDMIVNILLSQLTGDLVNEQPIRTQMETKTNMIVRDSETLMLGGILFQEKSKVKRKIPLLGDLPLLGGLFQHNDVRLSNNEMIIFITPFVISDGAMSGAAKATLEKSKEHLDQTQQELGDAAEQLREKMGKE